MYLPLHNVSAGKKYYFRIPVTKLSFFTVSLPLFSFIICVLLTMYKDFDRANKTHCNIPNIFPSISASIGNYEPQITIWKTAIYTHAPLRFILIYLRWDYYKSIIRDDCRIIVKLAVSLNIIENITLLGLTHWTSSLNYSYHEVCFKTFIAASLLYMVFICILLTKCRRRPNITLLERYSVKLKWRLFLVNASTFTMAAYFFLRHNSLCEPYVYSIFAFSEYIVVVSNILYHCTTVYDLHSHFITISKHGVTIEK
ncbi:post-GPI attachment to proteins factor 2 [Amyelois transitella]|uniref:post-GPI attachment to proteins factor 2 n=1 Tax=Amyelois transitella TaxID=680683 RepID=UPI00067ADF4C|nr:post-GPI attachment to proteins factor 2 [Amyelois transitella]